WYGLVAPAGMAPDVLERLRKSAVAALHSAQLKAQFASQNAVPAPTTPGEFADFVKAEQAKWGPVVIATGAKLECGSCLKRRRLNPFPERLLSEPAASWWAHPRCPEGAR